MFKFGEAIQGFWTNQRGDTALIFAVGAIPLMLAVGAALDYGRHVNTKTTLQASLDAATLAGAAAFGKSNAQRLSIASDTFDANFSGGETAGLSVNKNFRVANGTLITEASVAIPTTLMQLAGIADFVVSGEAQTSLARDKKAEIAMVLDYSGSMGEVSGTKVKYIAMKEAATKLVTELSAANPGKIKFGLVPFSHHVHTSLDKAFVLGTTGTGTWTGCTQDRQHPHNLTDTTPTTTINKTKWGQSFAPDHSAWGCSGYTANNLTVKPLTSNIAAVNSQLVAMRPYAWTHIALGVEFGYHLLSPNAPFVEAASYADADTEKFMIVLTDGMQTEPAFGPGTTRSVAQGESNLESLCQNAKQSGISIITLAFDLNDTTTRARLRDCASSSDKFFIAADDTDLSAAFAAIKLAIVTDIYLKK
jgi:Flp pilus assembly protein TadG